ncbi:TonB-dependent receptor [Brevundimonas bullata]|uniref:TonB-dependent receptor domain-containing protein n=1 Tax=Brevundimonas bullata TaxID=13160 RepID=UPI0013B4552E|nr:TonB-dependent receptor [Brevundimonas bullata]WQE35864.1 TonB-dependent receptor [Brevundimonas bullata]
MKRNHLFGTTVLAGFIAMSAPAAVHAAPAAQDPEATELGEVVVTGSRIARPNLEQPAPVSTITEQAIINSGTTNLGDILAELPGMGRTNTVRANADSGGDLVGLNQANLRSLGAARTLTLVNGKRHVGGSAGSTAVDLNAVPTALVKSIEVVTGGASAIYGSDAVSGVVNIILRDDFEGAQIGASYGIGDGSLNERWAIDATIGGNFAGGRGNVAFSLFADGTSRVMATEVPELALRAGTVLNPDDPTGLPGNGKPNRLWANYIGSDWIDERGVFFNGVTGEAFGFKADGTLVNQPARTGENSAAFGSFGEYCDTCFFPDDWIVVIPKSERVGFNTVAHYDLLPNVRAYVDAKYITSKFDDNYQPSFRFFSDSVAEDNAFLTPEMRAAAGADLAAGNMFVNRFLGDTNGRASSVERTTMRIVGGLQGDFDARFAEIDWDLSYNYGRTTNHFKSFGTLIPGNYAAALDAVQGPDGIVCRSSLPGEDPVAGTTGAPCVPYNPFIAQNTPEALAYVTHDSQREHKLTQKVVSGIISFDTSRFLNLPGGAIGVAGGFEFREESSANINDAFVKTGLSESAPQPDAIGGFDVSEYFAEVNLPLLADMPFAYRLSVDGAYRLADYSHSGEAEAWKVGFLYAPIRDVSFRGTYGKAVRAPNITEAFLPITAGFEDVSDPCDVARINGNPNRAANCALDTEIPQLPWNSSTNASIKAETGGNPNLKPETSESFTAGVVLQPRWVSGLALTIDYFSIEIEDAIAQIAPQTIINNCYDSPGGLAEQFCSMFDRNTDPNSNFFGNISMLRNQFVNTSKLETSGWDINLSYAASLDNWAEKVSFLNWAQGDLGINMKATHLEKYNTFQFQDRPDVINMNRGELGNPVWRLTSSVNWTRGPLQLGWEARFEDEVATYETTRTLNPSAAESTNIPYIGAKVYHDFIARLRLEGGVLYANDTELYIGINNAFDVRLPYSVGFDSSQYELFGRQIFGGVRISF